MRSKGGQKHHTSPSFGVWKHEAKVSSNNVLHPSRSSSVCDKSGKEIRTTSIKKHQNEQPLSADDTVIWKIQVNQLKKY